MSFVNSCVFCVNNVYVFSANCFEIVLSSSFDRIGDELNKKKTKSFETKNLNFKPFSSPRSIKLTLLSVGNDRPTVGT